jgi:hypothetical protein
LIQFYPYDFISNAHELIFQILSLWQSMILTEEDKSGRLIMVASRLIEILPQDSAFLQENCMRFADWCFQQFLDEQCESVDQILDLLGAVAYRLDSIPPAFFTIILRAKELMASRPDLMQSFSPLFSELIEKPFFFDHPDLASAVIELCDFGLAEERDAACLLLLLGHLVRRGGIGLVGLINRGFPWIAQRADNRAIGAAIFLVACGLQAAPDQALAIIPPEIIAFWCSRKVVLMLVGLTPSIFGRMSIAGLLVLARAGVSGALACAGIQLNALFGEEEDEEDINEDEVNQTFGRFMDEKINVASMFAQCVEDLGHIDGLSDRMQTRLRVICRSKVAFH